MNTTSVWPSRWPAGSCRAPASTALSAAANDLHDSDLAPLSDGVLADDVQSLAVELQRLQGELVRRVAALDARAATTTLAGLSTQAWLRHRLRLSPSAAAATVHLGRALSELPATAVALGNGLIGVEHAQVIARTVADLRRELPPAEIEEAELALVAAALEVDPSTLRYRTKHLRHAVAPKRVVEDEVADRELRYLRTFWTLHGLLGVEARLDPQTGALLLTLLDAVMKPGTGPRAGDPEQRLPFDEGADEAPGSDDEAPGSDDEAPGSDDEAPESESAAGSDARPDSDAEPAGSPASEEDLAAGAGPASRDGQPGGRADGEPGPGPRPTAQQGRADALGWLLRRVADAGLAPTVCKVRPHGVVTIDLLALTATLDQKGTQAAELAFAGPISAEAARRMLCDARITRVITGPDSLPLDVGRTTRTVPPHLLAALAVRDGGCAFPGCDRPPSWCDAHHVIHWARGGPTALWNLALLCELHHHCVHEGGWEVVMGPSGLPIFIPPFELAA